ncbi:MAG: hypothetical protein LC739_10860 [Actinobacteria bacterium]|nr:hypothetical protein [Actinomycetota bacterium]
MTNAAGDPCVRATISNRLVPTSFGRIIGVNSLNVGASSTACQPPGNVTLPGLFAGGTGTGKAMVLSRNDKQDRGWRPQQRRCERERQTTTLESAATPRMSRILLTSLAPEPIGGLERRRSAVPWPIAFNIADSAPGGSRAVAAAGNYFSFTGDQVRNGAVNAGIYYTTGKWELTRSR